MGKATTILTLAAGLALLTGAESRASESGKGKQKKLCKLDGNAPDCSKCGQSSQHDGPAAAQCPAECQAPKEELARFRDKYCKSRG